MNFLKTELERQMAAHFEAKELVDVHGHEAYDLAREWARRPDQASWQVDYWWRVAGIVERKLALKQQADLVLPYADWALA